MDAGLAQSPLKTDADESDKALKDYRSVDGAA
jgi:hypothetical protein